MAFISMHLYTELERHAVAMYTLEYHFFDLLKKKQILTDTCSQMKEFKSILVYNHLLFPHCLSCNQDG